jgi:hypothetical protein
MEPSKLRRTDKAWTVVYADNNRDNVILAAYSAFCITTRLQNDPISVVDESYRLVQASHLGPDFLCHPFPFIPFVAF